MASAVKLIRRGQKKLFASRHALSPIFSTLILALIIIVFGTFAYYYASSMTSNATNSYVADASNAQTALSERIGFENVIYDSVSKVLTATVINCGKANSLQTQYLLIYSDQHQLVGNPYTVQFTKLGGSGNSLNIGDEGYFTVTLSPAPSGSFFIIHLVTTRGSSFDYTLKT